MRSSTYTSSHEDANLQRLLADAHFDCRLLAALLPRSLQGWFKFGGVEFFKITLAESLGEQKAWENRTAIYLAAAAGAEFIADLFLCPLEAVRIRSVSDKAFPQSLPGGAAHILKNEGVLGFYAGLGPILFKQVPYTMAKFAVQGLGE